MGLPIKIRKGDPAYELRRTLDARAQLKRAANGSKTPAGVEHWTMQQMVNELEMGDVMNNSRPRVPKPGSQQ